MRGSSRIALHHKRAAHRRRQHRHEPKRVPHPASPQKIRKAFRLLRATRTTRSETKSQNAKRATRYPHKRTAEELPPIQIRKRMSVRILPPKSINEVDDVCVGLCARARRSSDMPATQMAARLPSSFRACHFPPSTPTCHRRFAPAMGTDGEPELV